MTKAERIKAGSGAHVDSKDQFSDLMGRLSHDLRAPVRAIVELVGWIKEDLADTGTQTTDEIDQYLNLLHQRGARLDALISNLMIYAKVGHTTQPFDGNWEDMIKRVTRLSPLAREFTFSTQLDAVPTIADHDLETLLQVLITNSMRHHDHGAGKISISSVQKATRCFVIVEDDGPGIDAHRRAQALEMFVTLNGQDKTEGSGLGLPIAQRIVDHYGGGLAITPARSGQGCRVAIWFPDGTFNAI